VAVLRIHAMLRKSRANGPGVRTVLWLQGCPFRCPECFNPGLRDPAGGRSITVETLLHRIKSIRGIEGISISGGEPTEQIPGLVILLERVRKETDLSILLFSGRTMKDILCLPQGERLISLIDVLVDGPYDPSCANPPGAWPSSASQTIHILSPRYALSDFSSLPALELIITEDGEVVQSGLGTVKF